METVKGLMRLFRSFTEELFGFGPQQAESLKDAACSICCFREAKGAITPQAMLETRVAAGVRDYTLIKGAADKLFVIEDHKVLGAEHSIVYPLHPGCGLYAMSTEEN